MILHQALRGGKNVTLHSGTEDSCEEILILWCDQGLFLWVICMATLMDSICISVLFLVVAVCWNI